MAKNSNYSCVVFFPGIKPKKSAYVTKFIGDISFLNDKPVQRSNIIKHNLSLIVPYVTQYNRLHSATMKSTAFHFISLIINLFCRFNRILLLNIVIYSIFLKISTNFFTIFFSQKSKKKIY